MRSKPSSFMHVITASSEIVRVSDLLFSDVGQEVVIFHTRRDTYVSLSPVGAEIWQRLERPISVSDLCDNLALSYDGLRATIEKDVMVFVRDMEKAGLIHVIPR